MPAIQSPGLAGNGVGRSYQLQSSSSITNPGWISMGAPVMATSGDTIFTAPMSGQKNFYRILLMP